MRPTRAVTIAKIAAWICLANAHLPGQEFQYLSLFMKSDNPHGYSSDRLRELSQLYSKESVAGSFFQLPHRRLLSEGSGNDRDAGIRRQRLRTLKSTDGSDDDYDLWGNEESETTLERDEGMEGEIGEGFFKISRASEGQNTDDRSSEGMSGEGDVNETDSGGGNGEGAHDAEEDDTEEEDEEEGKMPLPGQSVRVQINRKENQNSTKNSTERDGNKGYTRANVAKRNGEDIKRLSMMLMKLIKQYNIDSMVDVPCRAHAHWMPIFLEHLGKTRTKKPFQYTCVDTSDAILKELKRRNANGVSAKYMLKRFWRDSLPRADMVFSWSGLDNMKENNVLKYVKKLSASGGKHKLVLLGSHAGKLEKEGSVIKVSRFTMGGRPVNFRRKPFLLAKPMRIISELSTEGNDKQLYIYRPNEMIKD